MQGLSGYLLASTAGVSFERGELLPSELTTDRMSLNFIRPVSQLRQWDEYELVSPVWLGDDGQNRGDGGPYPYKVILIRGFSKVVLLAERRKVVDVVLATMLDRFITPRLRKVAVQLDAVVEHCQSPESPYLVTSLMGRFAGSARQLRTLALYGDDVTDSPIFRDYSKLFNVYSCGLGRRFHQGVPALTSAPDGEMVRIGNDGFVLAHLGTRNRGHEFMKVIKFLVDHRWVEPWVPVAGQEGDHLG